MGIERCESRARENQRGFSTCPIIFFASSSASSFPLREGVFNPFPNVYAYQHGSRDETFRSGLQTPTGIRLTLALVALDCRVRPGNDGMTDMVGTVTGKPVSKQLP